MPMRRYLITIHCLGQRVQLPTLARSSFDAWLAAIDTWPQACAIVVRPMRPTRAGGAHA